jgi:hypothetical protein
VKKVPAEVTGALRGSQAAWRLNIFSGLSRISVADSKDRYDRKSAKEFFGLKN